MANELFNQPLKTTLDSADRVAVGVPGLTGAYNITAVNLLKQAGNWNILAGTFDNTDLVAGTWPLAHAKNTTVIRLTIRNPAGYEQNLGGLLHVVDVNNIEVEFGGDIETGNWTYIFEYILL